MGDDLEVGTWTAYGRFSIRFRTQAHKLLWLGMSLLLLAALCVAAVLQYADNVVAALGIVWLLWSFASPWLLAKAMDRWGYRLGFVDLSPNYHPSRVERGVITLGGALTLLAVVVATVVGLVHLESVGGLLEVLGADLAVMVVVGLPLCVVLPFLVMVLSGFRVRPVTDTPRR